MAGPSLGCRVPRALCTRMCNSASVFWEEGFISPHLLGERSRTLTSVWRRRGESPDGTRDGWPQHWDFLLNTQESANRRVASFYNKKEEAEVPYWTWLRSRCPALRGGGATRPSPQPACTPPATQAPLGYFIGWEKRVPRLKTPVSETRKLWRAVGFSVDGRRREVVLGWGSAMCSVTPLPSSPVAPGRGHSGPGCRRVGGGGVAMASVCPSSL